MPCFVEQLDAELEVEGLGRIDVDVAYGGMWYAIADARRSASRSCPRRRATSRSPASGSAPRRASSSRASHPENPAIAGVSIVQIAEPWRGIGEVTRNAVVVAPGQARPLGHRHRPLRAARGPPRPRADEAVGDAMTHASPIGSTFEGRIVEETRVGDRPAIVPAIRGSAWITGVTQVLIDPSDPFPEGYLLSDTWGVSGLDSQ